LKEIRKQKKVEPSKYADEPETQSHTSKKVSKGRKINTVTKPFRKEKKRKNGRLKSTTVSKTGHTKD